MVVSTLLGIKAAQLMCVNSEISKGGPHPSPTELRGCRSRKFVQIPGK